MEPSDQPKKLWQQVSRKKEERVRQQFISGDEESDHFTVPTDCYSESFTPHSDSPQKCKLPRYKEPWMNSEIVGITNPWVRLHNEILEYCKLYGPSVSESYR